MELKLKTDRKFSRFQPKTKTKKKKKSKGGKRGNWQRGGVKEELGESGSERGGSLGMASKGGKGTKAAGKDGGSW